MPRRWLTDAARNANGIERFDILQDDGSVFVVDRRTDSTANVVLEQRPPNSGRWRLDR